MDSHAMRLCARLRRDLEWSRYSSDDPSLWIAHNPINREFYFFSFLEMKIAQWLDGDTPLEAILKKANLLDAEIKPDFVYRLVQRLDQTSLLLTPATRLPSPRTTIQRILHGLSYLVAWRVPLWNPTKFLQASTFVSHGLFHPWMIRCVVVAMMMSLIVVAQRWHVLVQDAMEFQSTLRGDRWLITIALLIGIKSLHEIGHAMACHAIGRRCHEIGVMFLFLVPCLYCDVSDVWKCSNRWQRMMVSAGGLYVELIIAILAAAIWCNTSNPWVQGLAVQVMLLCTLVTIAFNGNPLMRYDGYFVLSDWLRIPNLSEQCQEAWLRVSQRALFRVNERWVWRDLWMSMFFIASTMYRWSLLFMLGWGMNAWLFHRRLDDIAILLSSLVVMVIVFRTWTLWRSRWSEPDYVNRVRWTRVTIASGMVAAMAWMSVVWPIPHSVLSRGVIEPSESVQFYARHSGRVSYVVSSGTSVESDETIAEIESPELELERLRIQGELDVARIRLEQFAKRAVDDPLIAQQSQELEQSIIGIEERLRKHEEEMAFLKVQAKRPGWLDATDSEFYRKDYVGRVYGERMGRASLARDRPSVERGDILGELRTQDRWRIRAMVGERDIGGVRMGAKVRVRIDQLPGKTFNGQVDLIAEENLSQTPKQLMGDSLFASIAPRRASPFSKPEQSTYSVTVALDESELKLVSFGLATVRIENESRTFVESAWLAVRNTFW